MRFLKTLTGLAVSCSLALPPAGVYAQLAGGVGEFNLPSQGNVAGAALTDLEERSLGEQLMRRVRADKSYLPDPELTDFVNRLGYRLVAAADPSPYDFFFFPIRDKSLNAFALPGGFIAVHTGLIVASQTESELAGVIGHEIGHVTQRHIARMIESSKGSLAMTIGSILLALLAARAGGSSGGDMKVNQAWNNYSLVGNTFTGKVSGTKNVGGIIGYYRSLNMCDNIAGNFYQTDCGAKQGIGAVEYVDTS